MSTREKRFVITGIGPVSSLGIGSKAMWEGLLKKECGIELTSTVFDEEKFESYFIHSVRNFDIGNFGFDEQALESIRVWKGGEHNKDLLFFLAAVKLALDDSGIKFNTLENEFALIISHENPGLEQLLWKMLTESYQIFAVNSNITRNDYFNKLYSKIVKLGYETQSFMKLFHIAKIFGIHKYSLFVNNACASGQFYLEIAKDMILCGKSRAVIVVAGDCPDVFKYKWFKTLEMYPGDGKTKPFDKARNGFLLGEGAVALILEDFDTAIQRNARIYAEYLGSGFQLESWGITTPKIGSDYYAKAIMEAINNSGISKDEIDLVCAHGAATPSSDYYEAKTIQSIFNKQRVPVTALKPYVGHNLGGSNLMEIAILLLALQNNYIPPILNTKVVDGRIPLNLVLSETKENVKVVLTLCCAFAGFDAATI